MHNIFDTNNGVFIERLLIILDLFIKFEYLLQKLQNVRLCQFFYKRVVF